MSEYLGTKARPAANPVAIANQYDAETAYSHRR
jgi:hypothetical protein